MTELDQYKDTVYKIIGAAMTVHAELNWGLLEPIYNEALYIELKEQNLHVEREKKLNCYYKQYELDKFYITDLCVENDIIIELKSVSELGSVHRAQLFNYLRLTRKPLGILINFGHPTLQCERYAYLEEFNQCVLLDRNLKRIND